MILTKAFADRGYAIQRDVALELPGVAFTADGWDPEAKVGFEYLTHAAGDHLDLSLDEIAALTALIERGEVYVLLVDEHDVDTPDDLAWAAARFLDEVDRRRGQA